MSSLVSVDDFEIQARRKISKGARDYYRSGAGDELSLKLNKSCIDKIRIRPRFLRDISNRDLSCEIFGDKISIPLGISPTAMQKLAHPDGEIANARAAEAAGIVFTLSTIATTSIEDVAKAAPNGIKWFQLYILRDREVTKSLVRRAEKCNFKAIVLTIDAPIFGLRRADLRNEFGLPPEYKFANFEDERASGDVDGKEDGISGINKYVTNQFAQDVVWEDLKWLVSLTKLPVIVKGILTKEDAILAVEFGCKGIIVSNHGARQIDSVPASIEALPEIVKAVGDKVVIMMDGGITQGTDIYKALALGAKIVLIGRPAVWGLAVDGQNGVEQVIKIIRKEFDIAMALSGSKSIKDITSEMVVHESYYCKL